MVEHGASLSSKTGAPRFDRSLNSFGLLAGAGAFLAASCCVLPFLFLTIGLGGAWLGSLDVLLAYRSELQTVSIVALGLGWSVLLWRRFRPAPAHSDDCCQRRNPDRRALLALTLGTSLVLGSWVVWETQGTIRAWLLELRT